MKWLLDRRFAPITNSVGLIEADAKVVAAEFEKWQREVVRGFEFVTRPVFGDLVSALQTLLPLDTFIRRVIFVPTRAKWTALFDNFIRGSDVAAKTKILAERLHTRGVRATAVPHSISPGRPKGEYGAAIVEVYSAESTTLRSVSASNDGGRWVFSESGHPLPFEDVATYQKRLVRDRFTPEALETFLNQYGELDVFDEQFYLCRANSAAYLVAKVGPTPSSVREYSLEQAQNYEHLTSGSPRTRLR